MKSSQSVLRALFQQAAISGACLPSPADLERRLGAWKQLSDEALIEAVAGQRRVRLRYGRQPGLERALDQLVAAEATQCPFLAFMQRADAETLTVEISSPPGLERDVLQAYAGAFFAARAA